LAKKRRGRPPKQNASAAAETKNTTPTKQHAQQPSTSSPSPKKANTPATPTTPTTPEPQNFAQHPPPMETPPQAQQKNNNNSPSKLASITNEHGVDIQVNDVVYVAAKENVECALDLEEACAICKGTATAKEPLLECDGCSRGFHLKCLNPPLAAVPEGEWLCEECATLGATNVLRNILHDETRELTVRERFLKGEINIARVERIWREKDGSGKFLARWFYLPEDTHGGRQGHHHPREVYLSRGHCDVNDVDVVVAKAHPRLPSDYVRYQLDDESADVPEDRDDVGENLLLMEYVYDESWMRYRRINAPEDMELGDSDDDNSDNEDIEDDGDALFDPRGERRRIGGGDRRGGLGRREAAAKKGRRGNVAAASGRSAHCELAYGGIVQGDVAGPSTKVNASASGDVLDVARRQLSLSRLPATLPCRNSEKARLTSFVDASARGTGGAPCLYISGVPGTGKTATAMEVLRSAKRRMNSGDLPAFTLVALNGLRLASPAHLYTELHEALTGERLVPSAALEKLEQRFRGTSGTGKGRKRRRSHDSDDEDDDEEDDDEEEMEEEMEAEEGEHDDGGARRKGKAKAQKKNQTNRKKERSVLLIVDELDVLVTRSQSVLYNLFEWPHSTGAAQPLRVVGIANTMDLPERLMPRVASRIGACRLNFTPYSQEQLQEIVRARLAGSECFGKVALEYAARKVAAVSGDARRALELCRRAVEAAAARAGNDARAVTINDVDGAVKELFASPQMAALRRASPLERRALGMLSALQASSGLAEAPVNLMHAGIGAMGGAPASSAAAASTSKSMHPEAQRRCLRRLSAQRLVVCSAGCTADAGMASLNVSANDLQRAQKTGSNRGLAL